MSILYITEFADVERIGGVVPFASEPAVASQHISFTSTAGQSAAFSNVTRLIRVTVDGIANIKIGVNPTATAGQDRRMSAGSVEYYDLSNVEGAGYQISAVTAPA